MAKYWLITGINRLINGLPRLIHGLTWLLHGWGARPGPRASWGGGGVFWGLFVRRVTFQYCGVAVSGGALVPLLPLGSAGAAGLLSAGATGAAGSGGSAGLAAAAGPAEID